MLAFDRTRLLQQADAVRWGVEAVSCSMLMQIQTFVAIMSACILRVNQSTNSKPVA